MSLQFRSEIVTNGPCVQGLVSTSGITEIMEPWIGRRVEERSLGSLPAIFWLFLSTSVPIVRCTTAMRHCMYHVLQYKISWYTIMHCLVLFKVGSGRRVFFTQTPLHVHFKYPHQFLVLNQAAPPTSVTQSKKNSEQLRVFKTLRPWKELEAKAFRSMI